MPAAAASTGATVAGRRRRHPVIGAVARVVRDLSTAIWVVANKLLLSVILALLKWRDWRIVVALLVATVGSTGVGYGATAVIVWLDPDDDD